MKIEIDIPDDELRHCVSCRSGEMTLTLDINETIDGYDITSIVSDTYDGNTSLKYREVKESGGQAYNCNGWPIMNAEECPYFTKSTDYLWLMMFFANLFSDIGNIALTKNEMNNITMMLAEESEDKEW